MNSQVSTINPTSPSSVEGKAYKTPEVVKVTDEDEWHSLNKEVIPRHLLTEGYRLARTVFVYTEAEKPVANAHAILYNGSFASKASGSAHYRTCLVAENYGLKPGDKSYLFFIRPEENSEKWEEAANTIIREQNEVIKATGGDFLMPEI